MHQFGSSILQGENHRYSKIPYSALIPDCLLLMANALACTSYSQQKHLRRTNNQTLLGGRLFIFMWLIHGGQEDP